MYNKIGEKFDFFGPFLNIRFGEHRTAHVPSSFFFEKSQLSENDLSFPVIAIEWVAVSLSEVDRANNARFLCIRRESTKYSRPSPV